MQKLAMKCVVFEEKSNGNKHMVINNVITTVKMSRAVDFEWNQSRNIAVLQLCLYATNFTLRRLI